MRFFFGELEEKLSSDAVDELVSLQYELFNKVFKMKYLRECFTC